MSASFHLDEAGYEHQMDMPDVPRPDELPSEKVLKEQMMPTMPQAIRTLFRARAADRAAPVRSRALCRRQAARRRVQSVWIRATDALPEDPAIHQCVLAYASDMTLLDAALVAHGCSVFSGEIQAASLDHAMWFHRPFRADEWLLYTQDSPFAGGARGFTRGLIYTAGRPARRLGRPGRADPPPPDDLTAAFMIA